MSPNRKNVALVTGGGTLLAAAIHPQATPRSLAQDVARHPDWSPDGQYLVYIQSATTAHEDDPPRIGWLRRQKVGDEAGQLIESPEKPDDLASVLFDANGRVRCLPDGRVLFSGIQQSLPASGGSLSGGGLIFLIDPANPQDMAPAAPASALKDLNLAQDVFELSPDGKRVSLISQSDKAAQVYTLDLATQEVSLVQSAEGKGLNCAPSWRSANELCYTLPAGAEGGSANRPEVVLWSAGKTRVLSKDWPDDVVKAVAEVKQPATVPAPASQPATQPSASQP